MIDELSEGWAWVNIADVTEKVPNTRPESSPNKEFGYVDISAIDNSRFVIKETKHFKGKKAPSRALRPISPNDVLFSNVRTYLRNIALIEPDCLAEVCSTGFTVLRPNSAVEPRFLFRYVLTDAFIDKVTPQQTGTHYPATSDRVVMSGHMPLAPKAEQQRIVERLEKLLAEVEQCKERMAKIPVLLKRFRRSVLAAACSGRLTADFLGNSESNGWEEVSLSDVADARLGKMLDQSKNVGSPIQYLRNINVRWFGFNLQDLSTMRASDEEKKELSIEDGDLLVCEGGEPGRCAVWSLGHMNLIFQKAIHRLRLKSNVLPYWLAFNLKRDAESGSLEQYFTGSAIKHLTGRSLATYKFLVPPLAEQCEIVRRVTALFALADQIETQYNAVSGRVDGLTQSILAKAFRGELVPTEADLAAREGRDYESAAQLLERILASRTNAKAFSR